nr:MAG TPA: hypothetical protein [Caudoviricetes sp.]
MNTKDLFNIREMLCSELSEFSGQRELSTAELDAVHKLASSIKNIDKIVMFESGGYSRDDGYSREDGYSRDWDANIRGGYNRGSSYRRKRDSMGRYSRDDGNAKDLIERMMQDTDDPNVKEALRQAMHVVENG